MKLLPHRHVQRQRLVLWIIGIAQVLLAAAAALTLAFGAAALVYAAALLTLLAVWAAPVPRQIEVVTQMEYKALSPDKDTLYVTIKDEQERHR